MNITLATHQAESESHIASLETDTQKSPLLVFRSRRHEALSHLGKGRRVYLLLFLLRRRRSVHSLTRLISAQGATITSLLGVKAAQKFMRG